MDIQTRKIELIEDFLAITDETIIAKFESLIKTEKLKSSERGLKPMPKENFYAMIKQAKDDSDNGRVIPHQDLIEKVKTWK
ncbi:MAG: hypothetical protein DRJ05_04730 [Bacteroidetes bacterium]|nr:MAG: hypothetical protein DRJ05_04730 [Bacteroidota bacterium]